MAARASFSIKALLGFGVLFIAVLLLIQYQDGNMPQKIVPSVTPTPIQDKEVHSADGKMNLVMVQDKKDGVKTYTFIASDLSGKNKKTLFSKTVEASASMLLSPNSWSPNNKYVFLQEKEGESIKTFVFKASGEPFTNGLQYLDVRALFEEHKTKYTLKDATGWDAPELLHVTTMLDANTKGPSYWFEIPSKAFLQLATR